ncbi:MAG: hypothetical protein HQL06_06225 [Nitrospirae bacterium]|nr:hypothetical protein [Nitrospirota bacterium]
MIETKELETSEARDVLKRIVIDILRELSEEIQPPDSIALLLYQLVGDFRDFKRDNIERFDKVETKLDKVETRLDSFEASANKRFDKIESEIAEIKETMVTREILKDAIGKIGITVREII